MDILAHGMILTPEGCDIRDVDMNARHHQARTEWCVTGCVSHIATLLIIGK